MTQTNAQRVAKNRTKPKSRAVKLIHDAKERAERKGCVCTISVEEVTKIIEAGYCQLTGLRFDMGGANGKMYNPYAPSIDRIDPDNYNYTTDNVRIVLAWVNFALNHHGLDVAKPIILKLATLCG